MTFRSIIANLLMPRPVGPLPDDQREARRVHYDPVTERHLNESGERDKLERALAARKVLRPYHVAAQINRGRK